MIEQSVSLASNGVVKVPGYEQLVRFGYTKNRGVYRLHVDATGEWEGLTIRAFWHVPDGKDPASSLVVDGYVAVPASVTAQPSNGCITFEGSDGTKTVTSADLHYRVSANSGTEDGTAPEPGTPAWQQLVDAVHTDATAAEQAKADAQTAASEAAASAGNADQSAQEAADSLQELKDGIANGDFKGEKGDPGPAVALDTTLTHEGEAADAKATGDAISAVKARQNILVGTETGNPLSVDDAFSAPLCGLTVYGKSTQDGTPTPDAPVPIVSAGDSGSVTVKVTGKNLLYLPDIEERTVGGVTYSVKNGVIKIKGTSQGKSIRLIRDIKLFVGTWFFDPNPVKGTESLSCYLDLTNTINRGFSLASGAASKPLKLPEVEVKHPFNLNIESAAGSVIDMEWKPQMLLSDKLLPYFPYREQLFTLPTPNGLPGIPVDSGGNYIDPQGQQWVCDEVDLEKGVRVQRVGKAGIEHCIVSRDPNWWDASKSYSYQIITWQGPFNTTIESGGPCNRFIDYTFIDFYNKGIENGFLRSASESIFNISKSLGICTTPDEFKAWFNENVVLYKILATPIETPLTPAEIAAYKALTAYGPDTVVQASDGAGVKLVYQRDVNIAIKRIEDAIASMTTT
nr:MAG TPA: hypothetical protein [Caudoviricetes sp.]